MWYSFIRYLYLFESNEAKKGEIHTWIGQFVLQIEKRDGAVATVERKGVIFDGPLKKIKIKIGSVNDNFIIPFPN